MARTASDKPWWRSDRGAWYITLGGKQHNLGPDETAAKKMVAKLKLEHLEKADDKPVSTPPSVLLVADVVEEFLDWCDKHREPRTFEFYREKTQSFLDYLKAEGLPHLEAAKIRPIHLQKWADSHEDWKAGQKRQAIMSVQRAFNWAKKSGFIDRSPVAHVEKPPQGKRELVIEFADYQAMLDNTRAPEIHDLFTVSWETGCRPQEIVRVEARHVDLEGQRWVFAKKEAKGRKRIRIVYLSDLALEITKRLMEKHPAGKLFRNSDGLPWTRFAVNCIMKRLEKKTGKKFALVDFRHSFTTRALKQGFDPITLGNLMGHADTTMIARVYSHLSQDSEHLRKALDKANG